VNRPTEVLRRAVSAVRERSAAVAAQSERSLLLNTVLLGTAISAATGVVLTQYYSGDVLSSLSYSPADCNPVYDFGDYSARVGRHCFGDHSIIVSLGMQSNPWQSYIIKNPYPAAAMVPHMIFGVLGKWLGAPLVFRVVDTFTFDFAE
jgi:hypothetical protein